MCVHPVTGGSSWFLMSESSWCYTRSSWAGSCWDGLKADSAQGLSFPVFLLAGVDTICGPPHRMLLAGVGAVPIVPQKGA